MRLEGWNEALDCLKREVDLDEGDQLALDILLRCGRVLRGYSVLDGWAGVGFIACYKEGVETLWLDLAEVAGVTHGTEMSPLR